MNELNELQAGVDVAKASFEARLFMRTANGPRDLGRASFANDETGAHEFLRWSVESSGGESILDGRVRLKVAMEATGAYSGKLDRALKAHASEACVALSTCVLNPLPIKRYIQSLGLKNSTDKIDADAIALFALERNPKPSEEIAPERLELQMLVRARADIVAQRTAMKNRLKEARPDSPEAQAYSAILATFKKEIDKLEKLVGKLVKSSRELSRKTALLDSIPGVDILTAVTILAELGDLDRLQKRGAVVALAGLNPLSKTSGTSVRRKGGISKRGSPEVRRVLFLAVSSAVNSCSKRNIFMIQHERLIASGKNYYQTICAGMRKMLLIARALLKSNQNFSAKEA